MKRLVWILLAISLAASIAGLFFTPLLLWLPLLSLAAMAGAKVVLEFVRPPARLRRSREHFEDPGAVRRILALQARKAELDASLRELRAIPSHLADEERISQARELSASLGEAIARDQAVLMTEAVDRWSTYVEPELELPMPANLGEAKKQVRRLDDLREEGAELRGRVVGNPRVAETSLGGKLLAVVEERLLLVQRRREAIMAWRRSEVADSIRRRG